MYNLYGLLKRFLKVKYRKYRGFTLTGEIWMPYNVKLQHVLEWDDINPIMIMSIFAPDHDYYQFRFHNGVVIIIIDA